MCVAFIALSERTPVKLLVAFNRDEDYARPTRAARTRDDGELAIDAEDDDDDDDARGWAGDRASRSVRIVGCRDEKCGGTWLALCASTGKWALLTNAYGNAEWEGGGGGAGARERAVERRAGDELFEGSDDVWGKVCGGGVRGEVQVRWV